MNSTESERIAYYLNRCENAKTEEDAIQICIDATSDAQLFVFSELLDAPCIRSLLNKSSSSSSSSIQSSTFTNTTTTSTSNNPNPVIITSTTRAESYYRVLEIFAHGTVSDWQNAKLTPSSCISLNESQERKLRMLTLVTCTNGQSRLSYDILHANIFPKSITSKVDDDAKVEQVIRDAMSVGLVRARMDQRDRVVEISMAAGRDVSDINQISNALAHWLQRTEKLANALEHGVNTVARETACATQHAKVAAENAVAARKKLVTRRFAAGGVGNSSGGGSAGGSGFRTNSNDINMGGIGTGGLGMGMGMGMGMHDEILALHASNNSHITGNGNPQGNINNTSGGGGSRRRSSRPSMLSRFEV